MWSIQVVLDRLARGESKSAVARSTGVARKTIGRIEKRAYEAGWTPDPNVPVGEELAGRVALMASPARHRGVGVSEEVLLPFKGQVMEWLATRPEDQRRKGLSLVKVRMLLARQGVDVPYSSLHRFAVQHCGFGGSHRVTVRMPPFQPGEVAEIDFGVLGFVPTNDGKKRRLSALIILLPFSGHQYVFTTFTQSVDDVILGLEAAWRAFDGVPKRVVIDNMKAAVVKADRFEPQFNRAFERYARHRGFIIDAARPGDPQGKPRVERGVHYLRENFYRGETWLGRDHVQDHVETWTLHVAGKRVHGTTGKQPIVVFESEERAALQPLKGPTYDPPVWSVHTVHPDHHIQVAKAFYSLPTRFIGKRVEVESTRSMIRIYHDNVCIRTCNRAREGQYDTLTEHYPAAQQGYAMRHVDHLQHQADEIGPHASLFTRHLFNLSSVPWSRIRQAQALLHLASTYGPERLERACKRANHYDAINVQQVKTILQNALDQVDPHDDTHNDTARPALPPTSNTSHAANSNPPQANPPQSNPARFARPAHAFRHDTKDHE